MQVRDRDQDPNCVSFIETFELISSLINLRENVQVFGNFVIRFRSTAD